MSAVTLLFCFRARGGEAKSVFFVNGSTRVLKVLTLIPQEESVSVHKLTCQTGFDHRTVEKYVDLIIEIQNSQKIRKVQEGFRILLKKEGEAK